MGANCEGARLATCPGDITSLPLEAHSSHAKINTLEDPSHQIPLPPLSTGPHVPRTPKTPNYCLPKTVPRLLTPNTQLRYRLCPPPLSHPRIRSGNTWKRFTASLQPRITPDNGGRRNYTLWRARTVSEHTVSEKPVRHPHATVPPFPSRMRSRWRGRYIVLVVSCARVRGGGGEKGAQVGGQNAAEMVVAGLDNVGLPRLITRIYSQKEKRKARSSVKHEESGVVGTR